MSMPGRESQLNLSRNKYQNLSPEISRKRRSAIILLPQRLQQPVQESAHSPAPPRFLSSASIAMAPLTSNLTLSSLSYSDANTNANAAVFNNATSTTVNSSASDPSPDFTGTIIFGVIASVLAIMAIIIGYLQLRNTSKTSRTSSSLAAQPPAPVLAPSPPPPANEDV
jgi:hypothetical protein